MTVALQALLLLVLLAAPAAAQAPELPTRLEPVVVTPTRMEQKAGDAPAAVTVITRDDVTHSASQTVDDLLRQVPGFSLFRRSSSIVGHPTTQGLSLRGIGPSGTSRALVLVDGVPLNDPFGGWVYWSRVPLQAIEQIEVVRGGGSSLWGNYALGGVVHILTRRPVERAAFLETSFGTRETLNADLLLTEAQGPFRLSLEGNHFDTRGYPVVKASRRGAIDMPADSKHDTFNGRIELVESSDLSLFLTGNYLDEDRGNGTPLQLNRTGAGAIATGGRVRAGEAGEWSFALFAQDQAFRSTFSTQAADRNSETLALDQRSPSTSTGGWLQWSRRLGSHVLAAGADARWVSGETDERVYNAGAFARTRIAGGEQILGGTFVQDVYTPDPRWEFVVGLRGDYWLNYNGTRRDTKPAPGSGVPDRQMFHDVDRVLIDPRVAMLVHVTPTTDVRASAYQGFRVPTLNELYRVFRVRNDVTAANEHLKPERLTGGEAGLQQRWGPFEGRATAFWNEVRDLVANVTLASPLPDCPAGTTCRQRQNLDLARIRGIETELEWRLAREWRVIASHLYTDARVVQASNQRGLEGLRLAQVPENTATLAVRYEHPALLDVQATARYVGGQFEDDLNTLPLESYVVFDLFVSRRFAKWAEAFAGVENLFDTTYSVGRTSEGVISIGAPRLVRAGVRLAF